MRLTDRQIRIVFSKYILDRSPMANIMRSVIFDIDNEVDWQTAFESALINMPELNNDDLIEQIVVNHPPTLEN